MSVSIRERSPFGYSTEKTKNINVEKIIRVIPEVKKEIVKNEVIKEVIKEEKVSDYASKRDSKRR